MEIAVGEKIEKKNMKKGRAQKRVVSHINSEEG